MKKIFFLRHGDTGFSGRFLGATDASLTSFGRKQIEELTYRAIVPSAATVYCSPQKRCLETARLLGLNKFQTREEIKEIDFGQWEGKCFQEVEQDTPELVARWLNDRQNFCFPGGESIPDFLRRVQKFSRFLFATEQQEIVVVSHGGVIRCLLCDLLKLSFDNYLLFAIKPGTISTVTLFPEGGILTGLNLR